MASSKELNGAELSFDLEKLFKPAALENMYQCLVISREFLAVLKSRLNVSESNGQDLQFSFELPLIKTAAPSPDLASRGSRGSQLSLLETKRVKILLVEDNEVNMRIARLMLTRLGYEPDTAVDGLDAVVKMSHGKYDVILMVTRSAELALYSMNKTLQQDCDMPRCNGYDATEHIRQNLRNSEVIIIALTANSTEAAKQRCLKVGMNDFFTKPITMQTLSEMLCKWLSHEQGHENEGRRAHGQ